MSLFSFVPGQARARWVQAATALVAASLLAGCGDTYRPVVTPINPSGPPAQPSSLAVAISAPSTTTPGVATVIDYSGDTIMATAGIGPDPQAFTIDESGSTGYTINSDGTLTNFPISTQLQQRNVTYSTLPTTSVPIGMFSPSSGLWITDLQGNLVDVLNSVPETFKLSVPVAPTPIAISGPVLIGQRNYSISQNNVSTLPANIIPFGVTCNISPSSVTENGEADAIEPSNYTVSARIPLGKCPVYSIQSPDRQRFFVLNRGSDTITVINSQTNALDTCTPFTNQNGQLVTCHPTLPLSLGAVAATGITPPNGTAGMTQTAGPVYAEYNQATNQLVVSNYDGGTISIIDVSLDIYGNDSATFGTTFTVKVGNTATPEPASVTVLADGSRAYTANQNDGTGDGTVSIVNLSSHTLEKTLAVVGHPRTVVSTMNSLYGKVYVASPDSPYLSIIRTDLDVVDTTILLSGDTIDVRVTTQNGSSGNSNVTSRRPGGGQPCYLPTSVLDPGNLAALTLQQCQSQTAP